MRFLTKKQKKQVSKKPVKYDVPDNPFMEKEGIDMLCRELQRVRTYLEYGSGGSTVMAARIGVPIIHSIESDEAFLSAVLEKALKANPSADIHAHYVDIGPTLDFGVPADSCSAARWPLYCIGAWESLLKADNGPELILIDGRFRVACFLASIWFAKPGTCILFDDYFDREEYHVVEKYLAPIERAGRMARFEVSANLLSKYIQLDILRFCTNND
jgi:hypothetical protein